MRPSPAVANELVVAGVEASAAESAVPLRSRPWTSRRGERHNPVMPDQVLMSKIANALIEDAQARTSDLGPVMSVFRAVWGGLWVGGRVTLTSESVSFAANTLNRVAQSGTLDVSMPLKQVTDVEVLPGFFTNIVAISTPDRVLKIRCYWARHFAAAVIAARDAVSGAR